jgi:hypothetical protein
MEVIEASEMTVMPLRDEKNKKGKHVLVLGQTEPFDPLDTWDSTYRKAEKQGALLFVAHPELHDISFNEAEIELMVKLGMPPHGIEGLNGGAVLLDTVRRERIEKINASHLPQKVKDMIPQPGSNARAIKIHKAYSNVVPGLSAGSDAHRREDVGLAVVVFPPNMTISDAMQEGEILLAAEKVAKGPNVLEVGAQFVRGLHLDKPTRHQLAHHRTYEDVEDRFAA